MNKSIKQRNNVTKISQPKYQFRRIQCGMASISKARDNHNMQNVIFVVPT